MKQNDLDQLQSPHVEALDLDAREGVKVRRNVLLGLWAAAKLGLKGKRAEDYAWSVHASDAQEPGPYDVVAKVTRDLTRKGITVSKARIARFLREMEARAEFQISMECR